MRISNDTYDIIKWIAVNLLPATELFVLTLGKIWGLPYSEQIAATVAAVGVFLAAIIGISSKTYREDMLREEEGDE